MVRPFVSHHTLAIASCLHYPVPICVLETAIANCEQSHTTSVYACPEGHTMSHRASLHDADDTSHNLCLKCVQLLSRVGSLEPAKLHCFNTLRHAGQCSFPCVTPQPLQRQVLWTKFWAYSCQEQLDRAILDTTRLRQACASAGCLCATSFTPQQWATQHASSGSVSDCPQKSATTVCSVRCCNATSIDVLS